MSGKYLKNIVTLKLETEKCTGCGMCADVCPHGVFEIDTHLQHGALKKARIADRDSCMECGACEKNCPSAAISVNAGVGCAAAIINGILSGTEPSCDCAENGGSCC